jgi:endonuclease/exonuclease/phosphatase (EEP) superfamily protein YafD
MALSLVVVTALSFGGRWAWLLDLLTFWRPHLLVTALLLAGLAWLVRQHLGAGLALAAAAVNAAAILVPAGHAALPSTAGLPVKVITLNVLGDNRRGRSLIEFLRESDADVIALEEVSPYWDQQLAALAEIYPYRIPAVGFRPNSTVLLSRLPILSADVLVPPAAEFNTAWDRPLRAEIDVHGQPLVVYAVHPPTPRSLAQWTTRNAQLAWVADMARERDGNRPRIMLGDFNTPPWSFLFRDVNATAELRDAGGTLRQATRQPMLLPPHLAWLGAPVDHVLVSPDIGVAGFAVGPYVHSDHLPVIADLVLPVGGAAPPP